MYKQLKNKKKTITNIRHEFLKFINITLSMILKMTVEIEMFRVILDVGMLAW